MASHRLGSRDPRRPPLRPLLPLLLLACAPSSEPASALDSATPPWEVAPERDGPPNLLVVVADDLGIDKVGAWGVHPDAPPTPTIDGLAAEGLRFTHAYAQPTCSPTRAALLTGRYPRRTGIGRTVPATSLAVLSPHERTLPRILAEAPVPYASAAVGKWHLSGTAAGPEHPREVGFDHFDGSFDNPGFALFSDVEEDEVLDYRRWEVVRDGEVSRGRGYLTTVEVDDTLHRLRTLPEPWLVQLAFHAPHEPFHDPPRRLLSRPLPADATDVERFDAAVEALDAELGRLLDTLPEALRARTVVVFLGDNGTPSDATTAPFTTPAKSTLRDGGVRVPLLMAGPGIPRGAVSDARVHVVDLLPTLVGLAGVELAPVASGALADNGRALDGVALQPLLEDPDAQVREGIYVERFAPNGVGAPREYDRRMYTDGTWKLVLRDKEANELYRPAADGSDDGPDLLLDGVSEEEARVVLRLARAMDAVVPLVSERPRPVDP